MCIKKHVTKQNIKVKSKDCPALGMGKATQREMLWQEKSIKKPGKQVSLITLVSSVKNTENSSYIHLVNV